MKNAQAVVAQCQICKQDKDVQEMVPAGTVQDSIVEIIKKKHPEWSPEGYICNLDLSHFKADYIQAVLEQEKQELSELEWDVVRSMKEHAHVVRNINKEFDQHLTLGQRLSDKVAEFGGSWKFVIIFFIAIGAWFAVNSAIVLRHPFDPYPYIFLNLVLAMVAALQAPIIMMSQNRQEARDRMRAEHDFRVNLKAELEIRTLNDKMDHLLDRQWQRLLEIQRIQTEMMESLHAKPMTSEIAERV